jgi:hypothetical protein
LRGAGTHVFHWFSETSNYLTLFSVGAFERDFLSVRLICLLAVFSFVACVAGAEVEAWKDGKISGNERQVRFEVLTAASTKMAVFWVVALLELTPVYTALQPRRQPPSQKKKPGKSLKSGLLPILRNVCNSSRVPSVLLRANSTNVDIFINLYSPIAFHRPHCLIWTEYHRKKSYQNPVFSLGLEIKTFWIFDLFSCNLAETICVCKPLCRV